MSRVARQFNKFRSSSPSKTPPGSPVAPSKWGFEPRLTTASSHQSLPELDELPQTLPPVRDTERESWIGQSSSQFPLLFDSQENESKRFLCLEVNVPRSGMSNSCTSIPAAVVASGRRMSAIPSYTLRKKTEQNRPTSLIDDPNLQLKNHRTSLPVSLFNTDKDSLMKRFPRGEAPVERRKRLLSSPWSSKDDTVERGKLYDDNSTDLLHPAPKLGPRRNSSFLHRELVRDAHLSVT